MRRGQLIFWIGKDETHIKGELAHIFLEGIESADFDPALENTPGRIRDQAVETFSKGGFSTAIGTRDNNKFPLLDFEVDIAKERLLHSGVGKIQTLDSDDRSAHHP